MRGCERSGLGAGVLECWCWGLLSTCQQWERKGYGGGHGGEGGWCFSTPLLWKIEKGLRRIRLWSDTLDWSVLGPHLAAADSEGGEFVSRARRGGGLLFNQARRWGRGVKKMGWVRVLDWLVLGLFWQ